MRFASPENFVLFVAVFLLGIFLMWSLRRKVKLLEKFGDLPLILKNAPYISYSRQAFKIILLLVALSFMVVALARLQFGTHLELLKREGIDIMIALDVSTSMLARDMKPNRLAKAKQEIQSIIDRLHGDRVGLVVFAGEAFVQCPLTLDYAAARFLLNAVDQSSVSVQGTSLSAAIEKSAAAFEQFEKKHKVLLLLTDGEDHQGEAEAAAEVARKQGVKIYTVGIGNPQGEPIPILDRKGNQVGFKKDEKGEVVVSRTDEAILRKIALVTGGKFYRATAGELELDRIFDEISSIEKKELEGTLVTRYDDRFQWPLLLAIFLIMFEFFVPERKRVPKGPVNV